MDIQKYLPQYRPFMDSGFSIWERRVVFDGQDMYLFFGITLQFGPMLIKFPIWQATETRVPDGNTTIYLFDHKSMNQDHLDFLDLFCATGLAITLTGSANSPTPHSFGSRVNFFITP